MKKIYQTLLIFLLLAVSIWWAGKGIFIYKVFSTHDGNHHISRSFDAVETFAEGHFPLRWAGSLNYGCGVPIFDLFYPLIYYLVIFLNFIVSDILKSLNLIYFGSLALGTIAFYLWIKKETQKDLPALGGALLYLFAPYRFSLIFVRGSPEFLAYAILPLVLWLYARVFTAKGRDLVLSSFLAAIAGGFLAISHNFTVMFVMPILLLYLVVKILMLKPNFKKILWIAFSYISAFGLGSFFIGPALLEKGYTRIGENSFFWKDHFPTLDQLIRSPWGYFYSSLGTHNDGMSFMLGYAQWAVLGIAGIFLLITLIKYKFKLISFLKDHVWILFFLIGSLFTIYLILPWSVPVWEKVKILQEVQFSWRLLGIAIFAIAALFAFILSSVKSKYLYIPLFLAVVLLAVYGNRNHLLPQPVSQEDIALFDDFERLHPHRYSTTTFGDDVISNNAPQACWFVSNIVSSRGKDLPQEVVQKGNTFGTVKFRVDQKILKEDKIILSLGYFPGIYEVYLNGLPAYYSDCEGLVCLNAKDLRNNENIVSWKVVQSPIQNAFNYLTLLFLLAWLVIILVNFIGWDRIKKNPHLLFLLITFVLFVFFRFYRIDERIGFGWDQERDAWAVKDILSGNLTLLGPRVVGPTGFFLPPYFFYILAPFYALTSLHPSATIYFLVFYNILFFVLWYFLVRKMFNPVVSTLSLLLWAVHPLTIQSDSIAWNPVVIPLVSVLFFYALSEYFKENKYSWLGLGALLFGLGISFHFQFIMFAPIFIPVIISLVKSKKLPKGILVLLALAILPFTPLVLFDLKNNFLNLRQLSAFSATSSSGPTVSFLPVWERVGVLISGISGGQTLGLAVHIIIALIFIVFLKFYSQNKELKSLWLGMTLVWVMSPLLFSFLSTRPSEYYFNFLLPLVAILFGVVSNFVFSKSNKTSKVVVFLALLTLITLLSWKSYRAIRKDSFGIMEKARAVEFLTSVNNKSRALYIAFNVPYNEDAGYRYLISYYGIEYPGNPQSPMVEFLVPPEIRANPFRIGNIGMNFPPDWMAQYWINQ